MVLGAREDSPGDGLCSLLNLLDVKMVVRSWIAKRADWSYPTTLGAGTTINNAVRLGESVTVLKIPIVRYTKRTTDVRIVLSTPGAPGRAPAGTNVVPGHVIFDGIDGGSIFANKEKFFGFLFGFAFVVR